MIVLGMGSNVGDRMEYLRQGVKALGGVLTQMRVSPVYTSPALLPDAAPADWDQPFLNLAVAGETELPPRRLLEAVKAIEQMVGRIDRGHWSPRELDIDILAYGDAVVTEPDLSVPHAALLDREFALVPLADVAPDWVYPAPGPAFGVPARELAARMPATLSQVKERIQ